MNQKRNLILGAALVLGISMGLGTTAFAAEDNTNQTNLAPSMNVRGVRGGLTEEERAQRQAEREVRQAERDAMVSKWDNLTEEQKEAIYSNEEEIISLKENNIEKLFELGVIDEQTRDEMKERLATCTQNIKSGGRMLGGRGGCGRRN